MVNTVSLARRTSDSYPDVKQAISFISEKYKEEFDVTKKFLDLIKSQAYSPRDAVVDKIREYNEEQLKFLAVLMINQENGNVIPGYNLPLPFCIPPKTKGASGFHCIPDIIIEASIPVEFGNWTDGKVNVECKSPRKSYQWNPTNCYDWMNKDPESDEDDDEDNLSVQFSASVSLRTREDMYDISCTRIWQMFEQNIGMMLQSHGHTRLSNPKKLLQAGILIENDKIIVCILVMDYKVFKCLRNKDKRDAENSLKLLRCLADENESLCRFYVSAIHHSFYQIGSLGKTLQHFFCRFYE